MPDKEEPGQGGPGNQKVPGIDSKAQGKDNQLVLKEGLTGTR